MTESHDPKDAPAAANDDGDDAELRETLLRHYLGTAGDKLSRLAALLEELQARPGDAQVAEKAWTWMHTLAGNAGTYGFPLISQRALALSRKLRAEGCSSESLEDLFRFRDELAAAFAQARASLK